MTVTTDQPEGSGGQPPQKPDLPLQMPETRPEMAQFLHNFGLDPVIEHAIATAINYLFTKLERLQRQSKDDAIHALSAGFAEKMAQIRTELSAKEASVSSITRYFEALVADLTEKSQHDPKTKLMNYGRFLEQLESFLALDQRGHWCAIGLVDVTGFKWYNDALGHLVGDKILKQVALILKEQARSEDFLTHQQRSAPRPQDDLHARFGGDEFCFFIPDLAHCHQAKSIADRFREGVEKYDWRLEDPRLEAKPVRVDVGVVCLWLGRVADRRFIAKKLASDLIQRADKLMYAAKGEQSSHIHMIRSRNKEGELVDIPNGETMA
jgi:diguanylate cyclase (GGDEF)-like protein